MPALTSQYLLSLESNKKNTLTYNPTYCSYYFNYEGKREQAKILSINVNVAGNTKLSKFAFSLEASRVAKVLMLDESGLVSNDFLEQLQKDVPIEYILLHHFIKIGLFQTVKQFNNSATNYDLTKDSKKELSLLLEKLDNNKSPSIDTIVSNISGAEIEMIKNNFSVLTKQKLEKGMAFFEGITRPSIKVKAKRNPQEPVTLQFSSSHIAITFPNDFPMLLASLELIKNLSNNAERVEVLGSIEKTYSNNSAIFELVKMSLSELNSETELEIIIVPDDWQSDSEICMCVAMRDQFHKSLNGHAIILTQSEIGMLGNEINKLPLGQVYKISTIMHVLGGENKSEKEEDLCRQIGSIINVCYQSANPALREVTLRQCFSAGSRLTSDNKKNFSEAVNESSNSELVENIIKHVQPLTKEQVTHKREQNISELQTKSVQLNELGEDSLQSKLVRYLHNNSQLSAKSKNLLIKGYYGPVSPSFYEEEEKKFFYMRPSTENVMAAGSFISPDRFFKASRVQVQTSDNSPKVEHIKRKGKKL